MNVDVYIFLRFVVIFLEFFNFLCSVLRVSPDTDPSRRDRSVSVPAKLAAETATVNHGSYVACYCGQPSKFSCNQTLIVLLGEKLMH